MHQFKQRVAELVAANLRDDASLRDDATVLAWLSEFQELRTKVLPKEKVEPLDLVDSQGQPTGVRAPRWLCHLLALRHAVAHVVLRLRTVENTMLLLQVRSWTKADSPGHLDISVGGHVKCGASIADTAHGEMSEETGFELADLQGHQLRKAHAYSGYNFTGDWFHNSEWCEVYEGDVLPASFTKLHFTDGEVVGLYLCPLAQARDLLNQSGFPIASALRNYLGLDVGGSL